MPCRNHHGKQTVPCLSIRPTAIALAVAVLLQATHAVAADARVEFNDAFIQSPDKVDLSRFALDNPVEPGIYAVDIYINKFPVLSDDIRFIAQKDERQAHACFTLAMLDKLGLNLAKLNLEQRARFEQDGALCQTLESLWPEASSSFDTSVQRLDLQIPQALLQRNRRGATNPSLWDRGVAAVYANYNLNSYEQNGQFSHFLNLNTGANLGRFQLRAESNYTHNSGLPAQWRTVRTYLQTSLTDIQSKLVAGESFTSGRYFDSLSYTGLSLASEDRMSPDTERDYAPVIQGIALSQANVRITQGDTLLLESTVPPGPFEFNDLYPTGYGGDIKVTVTESNGTSRSFLVPYAAAPNMLRQGISRYSATMGRLRDNALQDKPLFAELSYSRGVSNFVTAYGGAQLAGLHQAVMGGGSMNTTVGAFAADLSLSRTRLDNQQRYHGWSLRLSHSYRYQPTQTSISLAAYRYSSQGYLSLRDAAQLQTMAHDGNGDIGALSRQKSRFDLTLGQQVFNNSQLTLTGSTQEQWGQTGRVNQLQAGYSHSFSGWSLSGSATRTLNAQSGRQTMIYLGVTVQLGKAGKRPLTSTSSLTSGSGATSLQTSLSGALGEENSVSYGIYAGHDGQNRQNSLGVSGSAQTGFGTVQASASRSGDNNQLSFGISGSIVGHAGGITLGQSVGESFAIIEAPNASGAKVLNAGNTHVDSRGYAIAPYLSSYRRNEVSLSPEGLPSSVELRQTSQIVTPYDGASVKLRFNTQVGRSALIDLTQPDGQALPAGTDILNDQGDSVGVVGQGGRSWVRVAADKGSLTARWGNGPKQNCSFDYSLPPSASADDVPLLQLVCKPGSGLGQAMSLSKVRPRG